MGGGSTGFRSRQSDNDGELVVQHAFKLTILPFSFTPATRALSGPCRILRS